MTVVNGDRQYLCSYGPYSYGLYSYGYTVMAI